MNLRQLPNTITGLRLAMAPVLLGLLVAGHYGAALVLALVAGLSDALDGWLAKRFGWQTRLGSLLDPVADKALLGCAVAGLWLAGALPGSLALLVAARDLVIIGGAIAWWRMAGPFDGRPSLVSKLTTVAQVLLVLGCLVELAGLIPAMGWWRGLAKPIVAALTVASGADYVIRYGVKAWRHPRKAPA